MGLLSYVSRDARSSPCGTSSPEPLAIRLQVKDSRENSGQDGELPVRLTAVLGPAVVTVFIPALKSLAKVVVVVALVHVIAAIAVVRVLIAIALSIVGFRSTSF